MAEQNLIVLSVFRQQNAAIKRHIFQRIRPFASREIVSPIWPTNWTPATEPVATVNVKRLPRPGTLSTAISPPSAAPDVG